MNTQQLILRNLLENEQFCRKAIPYIKKEYFSGAEGQVFEFLLNYTQKHGQVPTVGVLKVDYEESDLDDAEVVDVLSKMEKQSEEKYTDEWLLQTAEQWCKDQAMYKAVMESVAILEGQDKKRSSGAIPEMMSDALAISFDPAVGHDYLEDADSRFDFYNTVEERIPFDLDMMNTITNGGIPKKTLNIILAGTGAGKTLKMCHLASSYLAAGKNVLYITMEMAEERIAERIDANLFDIELDNLKGLSREIFSKKVDRVKAKTNGRLIIKEYPTAIAHTGHFRALLNELKLKKKFVPDVIFVDYLNICASARIRLGGAVNTYSLIKSIAEELRGLAVEFNVPIWSATQTNREGFDNSDVDLTNTSESFGLPATADFMYALINTDELAANNQVMVKQLKNRYRDVNKDKKFVLGIDRPYMRLYNVSNATQGLSSDPSQMAAASTPSRSGDYDDFKMD